MKHGGLAEICRTGIAPGTRFRGGLEESDVDVMAPRAIKMLDNKTQNKLIRESGFSKDHIKRVWSMCVVAFLMLALSAPAADITQGHVFTPGEQNITHVEMNAIVGSATINTAFFTAKSAAVPTAADVILFYSTGSAGFRKATLQTALYDQTALITSQTEDASPTPGDYVLTYDVSAGGFKKVTLQNALANGSTNVLANFPTITTPTIADFVPLSQSSTNVKATVSNLLQLINYTPALTNNPLTHTAPTNMDRLLIWDSANGLTKTTTLLGLVTNEPFLTVPRSNDQLLIVGSGTNVQRTTITNMGRTLIQSFSDATSFGNGVNLNEAHNFSTTTPDLGFPRLFHCKAQCTSTDAGYAVGDNVDIDAIQWEAAATNHVVYGFNSTNIFLYCPTNLVANYPKIANKGNGVWTSMSTNKWNTVIYATYFNFKSTP